ncbi:MAG: class I SAM-dependent methyltransferase [Myxococcales bacterium]
MPVPAATPAPGAVVPCVLCGSFNLRVLGHLPADQVHARWLDKYEIPVRQYFPQAFVTNYLCVACGLEFSHPPSPGDEGMYEQLQRFSWYYEESRWEFRASLERLGKPGSALEVGCGTGNFLRALRLAGFSDVCGVDSNRRALESLKASGIQGFSRLDQLGKRRFEYIFAFQVLEHVPDPRAFLDSLMPHLSDHGRIYVAVPNQDSFIGDDLNQELNQPPHHCSRFRAKTFRHIPRFLPLACEHLEYEPLSDHHIGWYVSTRMQSLPRASLASRFAWRALAPLAERALKLEPLRRRIKGHTVLAILRRTPTQGRAVQGTRTSSAL